MKTAYLDVTKSYPKWSHVIRNYWGTGTACFSASRNRCMTSLEIEYLLCAAVRRRKANNIDGGGRIEPPTHVVAQGLTPHCDRIVTVLTRENLDSPKKDLTYQTIVRI